MAGTPSDKATDWPMQEKWNRARQLRRSPTDAERCLWRHLRRKNLATHKFRRQYPIDRYIVDFVCVSAMLVVEIDGGQHLDAVEYDAVRTRVIEALGYRVLRFWNDDVLLRTEDVLEVIWRALDAR
jgi:very-short-patch-repair endonuclease